MTELAATACTSCKPDAPRLTDQELQEVRLQLPDWEVIEVDGVRQLQRRIKCQDFASALALAAEVGEVAEAQDHHPALLVEWGALTVTWWTHKIGGLHRNDAVMAARTDALLDR